MPLREKPNVFCRTCRFYDCVTECCTPTFRSFAGYKDFVQGLAIYETKTHPLANCYDRNANGKCELYRLKL